MLNWESSGTSWRGGRAAGLSEGKDARRQARALGHPDERPIVHSIDESVANSELDLAADYMAGFNDGGGCGPQGVYRTKLVIEDHSARGLIRVGWQTNARGWKGNGPDCPSAAIRQHTTKSYPQFPPAQYDENTTHADDWGQHPTTSGAASALGVDHDSEEEDDVSILMFLAGPDGEPYPYVVAGVVGKHLSSPEALALNRFLQQAAAAKNPDRVTILGEPKPLGKEWQDAIALLDGPLRNVP
jgi:hypothetical protein